MTVVLWIAVILAAASTLLILWNLAIFRPPSSGDYETLVSVLIPARNESRNIRSALESVLASTHERLEVLVLDDHSIDGTAGIVAGMAQRDRRISLLHGATLPEGGSGKNFACAQLADEARGTVLLFIDADVRLEPDAVARLTAELNRSDAGLISGVPLQVTGTASEQLLVPLIHFVLLGYLPFAGMRATRMPAFGAACGQVIAVRRNAYLRVGGHRAILPHWHDALALTRLLRRRNIATDLTDITSLASCRMYRGAREVLEGFGKNAHEGLGSPRGIVPWTALLFVGQSLPMLALPWVEGAGLIVPCAIAAALAYAGRAALALRFKHPLLGVVLHPFAVIALIGVQWYALVLRVIGRPLQWKDRLPTMGGPR